MWPSLKLIRQKLPYCINSFSGVKAYLHDRASPAWLPTLELGRMEANTPAADKASERYNRASQRKHKKDVSEAISSLLSLKKRRIDFQASLPISQDSDTTDISEPEGVENDSLMQQDEEPQSEPSSCHYRDAQTDLTLEGLK